MFAFLEKDTFPWWYSLVKWGIPLSLATLTGTGAGLMLTGSIGMPVFFGMLKWAPAFYASLEGASAIAVLGLCTTMLASTIGVLSSFILRGTILFPLTEAIATNAQHSKNSMQNDHGTAARALEQKLKNTEEALQQTDAKLMTITTQYDQLRGELAAHEKSKQRVHSSQPPANDDKAQLRTSAEAATGKRSKI